MNKMKENGYFKSPLGGIKYIFENHQLYGLSIEEDLVLDEQSYKSDAVISNQLDKYFKGELNVFDIPVVFEKGTSFQKKYGKNF